MCGQGQEESGRVCERLYEIALVAARMSNIQGFVEELHSWGKV